MKAFTQEQPKDGETVLRCSHKKAETNHFYRIDCDFVRPDLSKGHATWMVLCDSCFKTHPDDPESVITGDGTWIGDEPIVEVPPMN